MVLKAIATQSQNSVKESVFAKTLPRPLADCRGVRVSCREMSNTLRFLQRVPLALSALCLVLVGCAGGGSGSGGGTSSAAPVVTPVSTVTSLAITAVSPTNVPVGSTDVTLTVTGAGFASGNTVQVNGTAVQTTYVSSTQLSATVPAAQLKVGSVLPVAVSNGASVVKADPAAVALSVDNPVPSLASIAPGALLLGTPDSTVTVTGTNFVQGVILAVNGTPRDTTFVSDTQLKAQLTAADFAAARPLPLNVINPKPGGGTSGTSALAVNNPAPAISSVTPAAIGAGAADTVFTISGTGLLASTALQVNGAAHAATTVNGTQLTFTLSAGELASAANLSVRLVNPQPGGGSTDTSIIAVQNPAPSIAAANPGTLLAGSDATTVILTGTGFVKASTVQVNGAAHASSYVSPTEIDVLFPASELAASGTLALTVANAQPGGGNSAGASIPVNNPVPAITALSPANIETGAADTVVTISGTGFLPITTLQVDGAARSVSYVSGKQLGVKFAAAELTKASTFSLNLTNAAPGGGTSKATPLYVGAPSPVITSLSPASLPVGSAATTLTINGTGFLPTSTVQYGSSLRTNVTYVNSTQLSLPLSTTDFANDGTYNVLVINPAASGGVSRAAAFTVQAKTPSITSVTPNSLVVAGGPYTISVAGNNLTINSKILWNGTAIPTTYTYLYSTYTPTGYVYTYGLNGSVSNDLVSSTGSANVTVSNATAATPVSNSLPVTVTNPPVPVITTVSPNYAPVNADVKLTVSGTGFTKNSVVSYNGTALTTAFGSTTGLSTTVPASLLAIPGNGSITVSTPAPGGGTSAGAALSIYLPVVSNNMVFNPVNGLAYLSIPSTGSTVTGNSIVSMDPATGALGTPVFVGSEPGVMAVSDNGKTLWVALNGTVAIRKVDLVNNVAGAQYSTAALGNAAATAVLVLPGTTDSVAVTNSSNLGLYDAGVLRGSTVSVNGVYALQADSSRTELYAAGSNALQNYTYSTNGLTAKASNTTNNYSNSVTSSTFDEAQLANGKVFTDFGKVYDAESSGLLGSFTQGTTVLVGPTLYDAALSQVYVLSNGTSNGYSNYTQVSLFNPTDYSNTGKSFQWNIPYYISTPTNSLYLNPHRLARWGSNGLLLHTKYAIFTAQSNVVKDQSGASADLSSSVAAAGGTATGTSATYTVTVKNNGPQAATDVALALVAPATGVVTSTTSTTGTCTSLTGCSFGTIASNGTVSATVTVLQTVAGTGSLSAYVQGSSTDPDATNNTASVSVAVTGETYNLKPLLSAISPNAVKAGSADTTLTLTGSNFASGSQVMLGSTALTTKFVSATQLTATVPAANVTSIGWANVSVTTPAPGGGSSNNVPLTVFSVTTVGLNHVLYEPYTRKLYASVSSGSSTVTGSSVVTIDPATGTFGTPITFATVPTVLALSGSGNTLYTPLTLPSSSSYTNTSPFGRLNLANGTSDSITLNTTNSYYSGYPVQGLAVQPGTENTLATAQSYGSLILFDYDAASKALKQRGNQTTNYNAGNCVYFLDATNLLASGYYSGANLYPVTNTGIGAPKLLGSSLYECFQLSGNTATTPTGKVYNVNSTSATQLGTFVLPNTYSSNTTSSATDTSLGSAFYAGYTSGSSYGYIDGLISYDLQTYLRSGQLNLGIPTIEGSSYSNTTINDLVRWGQDGLAIVTSTGHLYLLRGPFVVPQELTTNSAATLSTSSSTALSTGSGNTLLTLTGTNFVPGVAVTWNGSYRQTTRLDATHVTVAIPASDLASAASGKLVATNPNAAGSNVLTVTVQ